MNRESAAVYRAIINRRTIRRFKEKPISKHILKKLINAARLAPSAKNLQPLEFIIVTNKEICAKVFAHIGWAGYLAPYGAPPAHKQPVAYIVVLVNNAKAEPRFAAYDVGAAIENILLSAWELGIGSCWIQAINRQNLKKILKLPGHYWLDSVIALGYCAEKSVIESFKGSVRYWKDKKQALHVPKRNLKQVIYKVI